MKIYISIFTFFSIVLAPSVVFAQDDLLHDVPIKVLFCANATCDVTFTPADALVLVENIDEPNEFAVVAKPFEDKKRGLIHVATFEEPIGLFDKIDIAVFYQCYSVESQVIFEYRIRLYIVKIAHKNCQFQYLPYIQ